MQVARCTKIISPNTDDAKYVINVKQIAKVCYLFHSTQPRNFTSVSYCLFWIMQFVVGLGDKVSPTDIEEGMRVGYVAHLSYPLVFSV